ncbi:MAG: 6-carboxytetrahydropterin synthase [Planctomycetota bacterium]|nr:MAG: 6-carboxytetrahydropterin synthase [Planctomycetota bacterium]
MHEITVEIEFPASHALTIAGTREPEHTHQWRVSATVASEELDSDGLVCDFHALQQLLERIVEPWKDRSLNATPPFDRCNPSAERVALVVHEALAKSLPAVSASARLIAVGVTEAPGCHAVYRPSPDPWRERERAQASSPVGRCTI